MRIVYKVKFENDGVTISQDIRGGPGDEGGGGQDPIGGGGQDPIGGGGQDPIGGGGQDPIGGGGQDPIGGGGQDPIGGGGPGREIAVVFGPVVIGTASAAVTPRRPATIPRHIRESTLADLLGPSANPRSLNTIAAPAVSPTTLSFHMLSQAHTNWCWAAVSAAVRKTTQCSVANEVLDRDDCCDNGEACNSEDSLTDALGDMLAQVREGTVSFEVIQNEIGQGRPLCARIAWDADRDLIEDRGHFVVISGCPLRNNVPCLTVLDPDSGRDSGLNQPAEAVSTEVPFEEFKTRYKSTGIWTHTYLLKGSPNS